MLFIAQQCANVVTYCLTRANLIMYLYGQTHTETQTVTYSQRHSQTKLSGVTRHNNALLCFGICKATGGRPKVWASFYCMKKYFHLNLYLCGLWLGLTSNILSSYSHCCRVKHRVPFAEMEMKINELQFFWGRAARNLCARNYITSCNLCSAMHSIVQHHVALIFITPWAITRLHKDI